jgi:hypothetical protein
MRQFYSGCEPLAEIDVASAVEWIEGIADSSWPDNWRCQGRPYVLVEPHWENFTEKTQSLVDQVMEFFPGCRAVSRSLTTVHPGEYVPEHVDMMPENWIVRIHVPLITNPKAEFIVDSVSNHLEVGMSYRINPEIPHAIRNGGSAPRVHLMFDVEAAP